MLYKQIGHRPLWSAVLPTYIQHGLYWNPINEDHQDHLLTMSTTSNGTSQLHVKLDVLMARCNKTFLLVLTTMILITVSCRDAPNNSQEANSRTETNKSCSELPAQFQSYEEAESRITSVSFQFQDEVNTSKSSWIRGASYSSCNGQTGYFMLLTDKKNYIFQGMPVSIWEGFKGADSFGEYYNAYIRDRYYMYVGQN